jgi:aquaporin related protein
MATHEQSSPLPQYYGQQLQDGTIMESPVPPRHHGRESSDSRRELLRLPAQAHIDQNMDPISPVVGTDPNAIGLTGMSSRPSNRRLGGHPDFNDYGSPTSNRFRGSRSNTQNQSMVHRNPYVEEYMSDDEYEPQPQPYRRRTRQHRPPPSAYENDPRGMSRYTQVPGRGSIDAYNSYNNDKPRTHIHYGSDDEYAPKRPPPRAGVPQNNGNDPPRRPPSTEDVMRLPWMIWMGSNAKNHFVAFVGEFVGTTMFLFFAFSGTQVANIGSGASDSNTTTGEATGFSPNVLLYIALVFSFSLMVNVWVFFRISGGLFNPAVTFAFLLCRAMSLTRASLLMAAQVTGSIFASYLVSVLFPTPFNVRTTLSSGTSLAQGVFIEAVLTAELVFTIFMLAKEKHKGMVTLIRIPIA